MNEHALRLLEAIRDMVNSKEFGAQILGVTDENLMNFACTLDTLDGKSVAATVNITVNVHHKLDPKPH